MKRSVRFLNIGVSVLTLLLIAALVLPFLVDMTRFQPLIRAAVRQVIAADVAFSGLRLTILPRIGIRIEDLRLSPLDRRWSDPVLQLDALELGAAWLPLMAGSVELVGDVDNLRIVIVRDGERSNLQSVLSTTAPSETEKDVTAPSAISPLPPLRLQSLTVAPLTVRYDDQTTRASQRYALSEARATLRNVAPGAQARLTAVLPLNIDRPDAGANGAIRLAASAQLPTLDTLTAPVAFDLDIDATDLDLRLPGVLSRKRGADLRLVATGKTDPAAAFGVWLAPLRLKFGDVVIAPELSGLERLRLDRLDAALQLTRSTIPARLELEALISGASRPVAFTLPLQARAAGIVTATSATCSSCTLHVHSRNAALELIQQKEPARVALELGLDATAEIVDGVATTGVLTVTASADASGLSWQTPLTHIAGDGELNVTAATAIRNGQILNLRAGGVVDLTRLRMFLAEMIDKPAGDRLYTTVSVDAPTTTSVSARMRTWASGFLVDAGLKVKGRRQALSSRIKASLRPGAASRWILARPDLVTRTTLDIDASASGQLPRPATMRLDARLSGNVGQSDIDGRIWVADLESPAIDIEMTSQRLNLDELSGTDATPNRDEANPATAPEQEFRLSATDLATLRPIRLNLNTRATSLILDGQSYRQAAVKLLLTHGRLKVEELEIGLFGGRASGALSADLNTFPLEWATELHLADIQTEPLIALVEPKHRKVLQAGADMDMNVAAVGTTSASIRRSLNGSGAFLLHDGRLNTLSLAEAIEAEFDAFVADLSIVDAAGDLLATAEKLMANPLVRKSSAARRADPSVWRKKYDAFRNFSIQGLLSVDKGVQDTSGDLNFRDGHLLIDVINDSPSGRYDLRVDIAPDDRLSGVAEYVASARTRNRMLERSPYASLLFDDKGEFHLRIKLSGTLTAPRIGIDWTPIREGFRARSRDRVQRDVVAPLKQAARELLSGNVPEAKNIVQQPKQRAREAGQRAREAAGSVRQQGRDAIEGVGRKLFGR